MTFKPSNRHNVKPLLFATLLLLTLTSLYPRTYHIRQDGGGDFTTISEGIEAAQNGDRLLVYPGIYYENINYNGKNIEISSLYTPENGNRSYIRETIIDGSNRDTVVRFVSGETRDAVLSGFTIRNGAFWTRDTTFPAGGIHLLNQSAPVIQYCIVEHNFSYAGAGGVASDNANPLLRGNIVRYNHGRLYGGIRTRGYVNIEFCNNEPNSVYLNYGTRSCDIFITGIGQETIVIDTLSVVRPDYYFVNYFANNVPANFNIVVNHGKIEPVSADLYVSPGGCDTNSGLTPEEPLQRISTALTRIKPSTQVRRTIHLMPGWYSYSWNNQLFPIQMRENIDIIGAGRESVILNGEDKYILISAKNHLGIAPQFISSFNIENLTLSGAHGGRHVFGAIALKNAHSVSFNNILVTRNRTAQGVQSSRLINFETCYRINISNFDVVDNDIIGRLFTIYGVPPNGAIDIRNIRFTNNRSSEDATISFEGPFPTNPHQCEFNIVNLEATNMNRIRLILSANLRLVNATITDNMGRNPVITHGLGKRLSIYNSIINNNDHDYQISSSGHNLSGYFLNVSHSLIENGIDGIRTSANSDHIYWGEGNIDTDPLYMGENDAGLSPYSLSEESPAREAGTLDIPDFGFSLLDLAGNPRIVDGRIDMGAYQWHPPTSVEESDGVTKRLREGEFNLRNFPNPAVTLMNHSTVGVEGHRSSTTGTNIAFELPEAGNVMIEIYNLKGQLVKRIFDAYIPQGEYNVFWDGRDERERYVATGFYMYQLKFNEQLVATGRCTFIK